MAEKDEVATTEWYDFIDECLENVQPFPFEVEYETLTEVVPSALTYVNMGLLERALKMGFPGIVISVCDYTREMLSFSFARAVDNILSSRSAWDFINTFPEEGELVSAGRLVAEYHGVANMRDGRGLRIKLKQPRGNKNNDWITNYVPLRELPMIQPAPIGSKATTERKIDAKEARADYDGLPYRAKQLVSLNPAVKRSVVLATSASPFANIPPTMLRRALLLFDDGDIDINDCLMTGRFADGELKISYNYPATGVPSLITAGRTKEGFADLFAVYNYLEEGGVVDILAIEAPTSECIDENRGYLEDIIDEYKTPIVIFCEESVLRRTAVFENLGFPIFIWGKSQIGAVMKASERLDIDVTHREKCVAIARKSVRTVPDNGELTRVAEVLYSLADNRGRLSERDEGALLSLINILGQTLRRTEMLIKPESEEYWSKIDNAVYALTKTSYALTESEVEDLREACRLLKVLCRPGITLPKEEAAFEAIAHAIRNAHHRVCLIVSRGMSEVAASEYWQSMLEDMLIPRQFVRVVTPRTFLKQECTSDDEEVFISGWFRREEMERLLESGLSSIFSLFLYRSCDETELENRWFSKADEYWKKHHAAQKKKAYEGLKQLKIVPPQNKNENSVMATRNEDDSLPGIARSISRDYSRNQSAHPGEESCVGRLVWFSNGTRRWLRINDSGGDTLLVVTNALDDDSSEGYCRKTASALQEDDIVLKTDADGDAISEACKEFGSYDATLAVARSWYEPIEKARKMHGRAAVIRKIQQAGCKRNRSTISNWVDGKTRIAPSEVSDIECIGEALGCEFTKKQLDEITMAAAIIVGDRISGGRKLAKDIAEAFVEEARSCNSLEGALKVFKERHSNLGEIELLYVDYVGEPETVSISRFGYYTD